MKLKAFILLILLLPLIPFMVKGQDKKARLEADKLKLEEEIRYTSGLLDQTRTSRESSVNELQILGSRITMRQQLINTLNAEVWLLNERISSAYDSVAMLEEDLVNLREEYGRMIYYAYKNKNLYDRLMFIFAAEDFNQAYQRLRYFQLYNEYRRTQAGLIEAKQAELIAKNRELEIRRSEKMTLLAAQQVERDKLAGEKADKDVLVKKLSKKEKELQRSLREKEEAARKLQKAIEDVIAEEIRLAAEKAKPAGTVEGRAPLLSLSAEEMQLSVDFVSNRGRLPWPLEKGVVSSTFGEHPHPVLSNVKIRNNGVDILTDRGSAVRAVFGGVVTRVINVPSYNNVVIIRHGEFLTVYSNLDRVMVRKDMAISTGQQIGTVYTDPDGGKTELHFEIWQSKTLLNPTEWLRP
jgi:septal ring factor EnvC (AmiA/AmiB activator)